MAHLSLAFLGKFQAALDGLPVTRFDTRKTRLLLAYLADEPGRVYSRVALADLLWPERSENQALNDLRNNLAVLRRAIQDQNACPPFLLVERETIGFNPNSQHTVDTVEFQRLISESHSNQMVSPEEARRLKLAATLYQGDFLECLLPPDCPTLEAWILARRTYYRARMGEVLLTLGKNSLGSGENGLAVHYARHLLTLEPWREEACMVLMESLARDGNRSEALAEFAVFIETLKRELDVEPGPESRRLYESICAGIQPNLTRHPPDGHHPGQLHGMERSRQGSGGRRRVNHRRSRLSG